MPTFTNIATLSYSGGTVNSNTVTGELQEVLSATKTAVRPVYGSGDRVAYAINLINTGATALTDLTLTDNLGAYALTQGTAVPLTYVADSVRVFVNGVLQAAPTVQAGPPLVITGIRVPAGGNTTVLYEADVNSFAPLDVGATVVNEVQITGAGLTTAVTATETITAAENSDLRITKALDPTVVPENGTLTYTFTVENYGNQAVAATDNAVLTDTFNPILSNLTVTLDGQPLTAPTDYTYNQVTGQFSTQPGRILVPAATYTQNADGSITVTPGTATLVVTGTV